MFDGCGVNDDGCDSNGDADGDTDNTMVIPSN